MRSSKISGHRKSDSTLFLPRFHGGMGFYIALAAETDPTTEQSHSLRFFNLSNSFALQTLTVSFRESPRTANGLLIESLGVVVLFNSSRSL